MKGKVFHQPDEAKMRALLEACEGDASGVVLRLAWRAGLIRNEIFDLKWEQVDFADSCLHLPDRDVPMENELSDALRRWQALFGEDDVPEYVASSLSKRERYAEVYLSRMARAALDGGGMPEVRLVDLRHDFVRRMMERYDWHYAIRVCGLSVTTYRTEYIGDRRHGLPAAPMEMSEADRTERLWKIMQDNRDSAAGIGLWLTQQAALQESEIVDLTWDQVDLKRGVIQTKRGAFYIIKEVIDVLAEEKARRDPGDDPHVILSPRSRKPMDKARLSTIMHNMLVHGGLDILDVGDLRHADRIRRERERILQRANEAGFISRREVESMLGVKANIAYSRLSDLVDSGELVCVSNGYCPASVAVRPEERESYVLRRIGENGAVTPAALAAELHVGKRTAVRLLKRMVSAGTLVERKGRNEYQLPAQN